MQHTAYYRLGDTVGQRTVGPIQGPYTVAVRLPEGARQITEEEYQAALEEHRQEAEAWRRAENDRTTRSRNQVYAEAISLGFSEQAARTLSGRGDG